MVRGRLNAVMDINESDDNEMDTSENRKRQRSEAISDDEDANPRSDSMLTQTSMLGSPVTGQLEAIREQTMRVSGQQDVEEQMHTPKDFSDEANEERIQYQLTGVRKITNTAVHQVGAQEPGQAKAGETNATPSASTPGVALDWDDNDLRTSHWLRRSM